MTKIYLESLQNDPFEDRNYAKAIIKSIKQQQNLVSKFFSQTMYRSDFLKFLQSVKTHGDYTRINWTKNRNRALTLIDDYKSLITAFDPTFASKYSSYDASSYVFNLDLRYKDSVYVASLLDFIWKTNKQYQWFNIDGKYKQGLTFRDSFHGVRRCLQFLKEPEDIFTYYFKVQKVKIPNTVQAWLTSDLNITLAFFSYVKRAFHSLSAFLPPIFYIYMELDTIAGYPTDEYRAQDDSAYEWLTKDVPDTHSDTWWCNECFSVLMEHSRDNIQPILSFEQFVHNRWLWVTDGASPDSKLKLGDDVVKTKFGAAVSLTDQELLALVYKAVKPTTVNLTIFIKPDERGHKKRLIANMDMGSYLIAAYIKYLIEYIDGAIPKWMTATTDVTVDYKVINLLRQGSIANPLDESQFDHHLSSQAWEGFISALNLIFPGNFGVQLFKQLFQNTNYYDEDKKQIYHWRKGMPSGLALTAIGNTLFNYIKQKSILSPIHFALGDDVLFFNDKVSLNQLEKYYSSFGSQLNKLKNWQSNRYAEYLHFLYSDYCRVGYPARMYGSLMYGLRFSDTNSIQRLNELATLWKDFYDRSALSMDENLVAADLSRSVSQSLKGFDTKTAKQWLHSPKVYSGFGLIPYNRYGFKFITTACHTVKYTDYIIKLPDVTKTKVTQFEKFTYSYNNYNFRLGPPLHLPEIQTLNDWEQRLNFSIESFSSGDIMNGMATVPLPEIPFISSNRLSAIAQSYQFNYYPNSTGNSKHKNDRLLSASLALVSFTRTLMSKYAIVIYV